MFAPLPPRCPGAVHSIFHRAFLCLLVVAAGVFTAPAVPAAPPATPQYAVLLYDGRLQEQVELEAAVRAALKPYGERMPLRTLHAGKSDSLPFMRPRNLTREDAPLFFLLNGPGDTAKIIRRVRLQADDDADTAVNGLLKTLGLPIPRLTAAPTGTIARIATDGGEPESAALVSMFQTEVDAEARTRRFFRDGIAIYRLRLPASLQRADLRADIGGSYVVEWSMAAEGPWQPLMDSARYFGAVEGALSERREPVADLGEALKGVGGTRFLRVYTGGRGEAVLARLEVVAQAKDAPSGAVAWLAEAERLRTAKLAALLPNGGKATALGGVLTKDTTLEAKLSPYLLGSDLVVPEEVTLTVEPGVVVWTVGRRTIRVEGRLSAVGTTAKPILFLPAVPSGPDDWRGIQIRPTVGSKLEPSRLEYCRISNAEGVSLEAFTGEVSHSVFEGGLAGVTLGKGSVAKIHHNRFTNCLRGLTVEGGSGEASANEFRECQVALFVGTVASGSSFRFAGNSVVGSRVAAVNYLPLSGAAAPTLELAGNYWEGPADRLVASGGGQVKLDPRASAAPAGLGPGY